MNRHWIAGLICVVLLASAAFAGPITVINYSMANGGVGSFIYEDTIYSPCGGACTVAYAALSGGTGKLTDGIASPLNFNAQGPLGSDTTYVGWFPGDRNEAGQDVGTNPTVTFNFSDTPTVRTVGIHVDNARTGGVTLPASVTIGGTNFSIAPDASDLSPHWYYFTNLNLTGSSVNVQFFQQPSSWVMVDEVTFDSSDIPEPAPWTMLVCGLALLGVLRLKAKAKH